MLRLISTPLPSRRKHRGTLQTHVCHRHTFTNLFSLRGGWDFKSKERNRVQEGLPSSLFMRGGRVLESLTGSSWHSPGRNSLPVYLAVPPAALIYSSALTMIPVWWVCVCTRVCVCAQAGGNEQQVWHLQVYRWTSLFCIMHFVRACVWVWSQTVNQGQTLEWDRQTGREGGRGRYYNQGQQPVG